MLGLGAAVIWGALAAGPFADADDGVQLQWTAPERCPAAETVRQWLAHALADSATDSDGIVARATVTELDGRLTLELELQRPSGPAGHRTMQALDCEALARTTVLIVALAVDPNVTIDALPEPPLDESTEPVDEPRLPPEPVVDVPDIPPEPPSTTEPDAPAAEPPSTAAPEPPDVPATEGRPPSRAPWHADLRAQAAAGLSVLPSASAALSVIAALGGRAWRTELGATYWTPVESRPDGTTGGRIQQWTIDARGCGVVRPGPLELPLCGGFDVGAVHGQGLNVSGRRRVASLRLAVAAGAALVWRPRRWRERWGLWVGGDVLIPVVRARFRATPAATTLVYHTPAVGGRAGAGIELRFR